VLTGFKKVNVLGCGWLGFPLAKHLLKEGYEVKGSTTGQEKIRLLQQAGIKPYLIEYHPSRKTNPQDFFESDILFLNIPFRRDLADPRHYTQQIEAVIDDLKRSPIKFVIFASSTAVYPEHLKEATEDVLFTPENERAGVLKEAEELLLNQTVFATTVIRFGGLYAQDRPIGKFLAGKTGLKDPHKPVNLIHLDDCIAIVALVIKKNIRAEVLNAVSDRHPSRQELYTQAASSSKFEAPVFVRQDTQQTYKIVRNDKLKKLLRYRFIHPDPSRL